MWGSSGRAAGTWPRGRIFLALASSVALLATLLVSALGGCLSTGSSSGKEETVPLTLVEGPAHATLALVPVYIHGQGPFAFALDTGASKSVIDAPLARQLNLTVLGSAGEVTGVTGAEKASAVEISDWRVGDIGLPRIIAIELTLPEPNRKPGLRGLLGSDVLSRYGAITVDYSKRVLVLRAHD